MIAKKYRVPIGSFYTAGHRADRFARNRYFTVLARTTTLPYTRFGVVVSKQKEKKAVRRNRLRRIVFAALPRDMITGTAGYDVVILPQASVATLSVTAISDMLTPLIRRVVS